MADIPRYDIYCLLQSVKLRKKTSRKTFKQTIDRFILLSLSTYLLYKICKKKYIYVIFIGN